MNPKGAPIIIKKKKGHGHGGHHGGAWKVAYADFVTAMMAFFLVMWILGLSDRERQGIAEYFKNPGIFTSTTSKDAKPIQIAPPNKLQVVSLDERSPEGGGCDLDHPEGCPGGLAKNFEAATLGQKLKEKLEDTAAKHPEIPELKDAVTVELTKDGLRIEMTDSDNMTFFQVGGAKPTKAASIALQSIAKELKGMKNPIEIEGHTDRRPYPGSGYTNWELSSERANAARKILDSEGIKNIAQVSGLADTKLRKQEAPYDVSNRRVSILVRN